MDIEATIMEGAMQLDDLDDCSHGGLPPQLHHAVMIMDHRALSNLVLWT